MRYDIICFAQAALLPLPPLPWLAAPAAAASLQLERFRISATLILLMLPQSLFAAGGAAGV
jgi:hypothetical protein